MLKNTWKQRGEKTLFSKAQGGAAICYGLLGVRGLDDTSLYPHYIIKTKK